MAKRVLVLNGPNLNMLGIREPATYGSQTLADIEKMATDEGKALGLEVTCKQSNIEGELVTWIQQALGAYDAIVINPGAYSHTSIAIHDAFRAVNLPVVEVHLSNIYTREPFRHHSFISKAATGIVAGLGPLGYELSITAIAKVLEKANKT